MTQIPITRVSKYTHAHLFVDIHDYCGPFYVFNGTENIFELIRCQLFNET